MPTDSILTTLHDSSCSSLPASDPLREDLVRLCGTAEPATRRLQIHQQIPKESECTYQFLLDNAVSSSVESALQVDSDSDGAVPRASLVGGAVALMMRDRGVDVTGKRVLCLGSGGVVPGLALRRASESGETTIAVGCPEESDLGAVRDMLQKNGVEDIQPTVVNATRIMDRVIRPAAHEPSEVETGDPFDLVVACDVISSSDAVLPWVETIKKVVARGGKMVLVLPYSRLMHGGMDLVNRLRRFCMVSHCVYAVESRLLSQSIDDVVVMDEENKTELKPEDLKVEVAGQTLYTIQSKLSQERLLVVECTRM